ncbi:hypothetical protein [Actinomadura sp. DC4]|uniref:hypothetical protein n=1 Tax=Actinomadura sp. DC4 TaxID=3055069 RepID=UPI0025B0BD6F|nr:hypothetical protein [Actinomadura sp. DC4]MDN3351970.1 hypothetical protein [Actinomadura sp. DC4]
MKKPENANDVVPLVPAPGGGVDTAEVEDAIRAWVTHPAFMRLVADFGGPAVDRDLPEYLAALEEFSVAWDFRAGRERNLAHSKEVLEGDEGKIFDAARTLGLRDAFERPAKARYDHCLILGGMVRACVVRPLWAAGLRHTGVEFGDVTALGGFRRLGGDEPALAEIAGMGDVVDELHAMDVGLRRAFAVAGEPKMEGEYIPEDPNRGWAVRRYHADGLPLTVVAAPSTQPETRRANTADTYAWWAENVAELGPGHRVLLVTSAIYVPFQHADAVRMLASVHGCAVETVGAAPELTGGLPQQNFAATNYLQEMRSTIRAMRMLQRHLRQDGDTA